MASAPTVDLTTSLQGDSSLYNCPTPPPRTANALSSALPLLFAGTLHGKLARVSV